MFVCVTVTFKIVTFPCVVKTACPHKINRIFLYCSYFFFFFFFLSLVRYINLICIISGKITDSQMTTVHPQCPQVQNKKKKSLSCNEYVYDFSMFLFIPFIANSPLETRTSEHSLHSLRSRAGKGKWRQAGQVNRGTVGLNFGHASNPATWRVC